MKPYPDYPDALIARILRSVKTIAMVGASPNEARPVLFRDEISAR